MEKVNLSDKQKIELGLWIVKNNKMTALTGSIMLKMRGIDIPREINDIDIVVPNEDVAENLIFPPCGFDPETDDTFDEINYETEADENIVYRHYWFGNKIEVFVDKDAYDRSTGVNYIDLNGGTNYYRMATVKDLLKAKERYVRYYKNDVKNRMTDFVDKTLKDIEIINRWIDETEKIVLSACLVRDYDKTLRVMFCDDKYKLYKNGFYWCGKNRGYPNAIISTDKNVFPDMSFADDEPVEVEVVIRKKRKKEETKSSGVGDKQSVGYNKDESSFKSFANFLKDDNYDMEEIRDIILDR